MGPYDNLHDALIRSEIKLKRQVEKLESENQRLVSALKDVAEMAERYNYVGWQRIVGQMQKRAIEALKSNNK